MTHSARSNDQREWLKCELKRIAQPKCVWLRLSFDLASAVGNAIAPTFLDVPISISSQSESPSSLMDASGMDVRAADVTCPMQGDAFGRKKSNRTGDGIERSNACCNRKGMSSLEFGNTRSVIIAGWPVCGPS